MVKRPAKDWFRRCVKGVTEKGGAYDPDAVCGNVWFNILSIRERRKIVREERRKRR